MIDVLLDTLFDILKLIPFLFAAFLFLEFIEHKMTAKTHAIIQKSGKFGPVIGGILGAVPQCGFSAMSSNLYATRVITLGTLIAIYLSTSDEMLLIMLSDGDFAVKGLIIVGIKVVIGIVAGVIIDFILRKCHIHNDEQIKDFCELEHCKCSHGIFRSALYHTLKITAFVAIITVILNFGVYFLGDDFFGKIMLKGTIFAPFIASAIGLIPNCAASVAITELYISGAISFGSCLAGLLSGCGVGLLILFKVNKPMKQNLVILGIVFLIGSLVGLAVDVCGFAL